MKELPHDILLEKAILGSMILNPDCKPPLIHLLTKKDFYLEAHKILFDTISETDSDMVLIAKALEKAGNLKLAGGISYLGELLDGVGTSAPAIHYANQLKEIATRRELIKAGIVLVDGCNSVTKPLNDTLHEHKQAILELETKQQEDYASIKKLLENVLKDIERRTEAGSSIVGVATGYDLLDENMQGFERGTQIIIAARPSVGKTALMLNIAENMAKAGIMPLIFSLEMSGEAITRRRLACESNVFLSRIRSGQFEGRQLEMTIDSMSRLHDRKYILVDNPRYKVVENLIPMAESIALKEKISAIFIDHIQLMRSAKQTGSRHLEISFISDALKSLAKTLKVPVIILCQLNRAIEGRDNKRPTLRDLKESGDLEQNADSVIGLYREDNSSELLEVAGLKGRDTGTWKGELRYDRFVQRITPMPERTPTYH